MPESLCGVWVDKQGVVHLSRATPDGGRASARAALRPFAWLTDASGALSVDGVEIEALHGSGVFTRLAHAERLADYEALLKTAKADRYAVDSVRPPESQFLLQTRQHLFSELGFGELRRCQLDIETACSDGTFSNPAQAQDRVLAIGLRFGERDRTIVLAESSDAAEKALLEELNRILAEEDPDTIEGHNIFKFDLAYLRQRCRRHHVPCAWGRFGQHASFRNSRMKVAERWIDFPRCDLPGRTVVDTYLLVQVYDITTRELTSYSLKNVAVYFGITSEEDERTYLAGEDIQHVFAEDRPRFLAYLADDLRETRGIADLLLPTYFEQAKTFPILFQEATLRGTTGKIDLLFLEHYYHARQACPAPAEMAAFAGGYTRSFQDGVFRKVLHFDVASLYPSLLLSIGRNPRSDSLGVFIPLLTELREYRLRYKQLARTAETPALRNEYQARQTNFKILINSFYGYLGFSGARFGDGELAAEVTRRGRELLQNLIDAFIAEGCTILEADTDGIYVSCGRYFAQPETLLGKVARVLPDGIELEHDGTYPAMFCYKSKNYALYDGQRVIIRGSALRSRGIEPFLKKLNEHLIRFLLGAETRSPKEVLQRYREQLRQREMPVEMLAKSEILGVNPESYERLIADGGKPRRATAEVALRMHPRPRMGERVSYYIAPGEKGAAADWQRACPLKDYHPETAPYDPDYYLKKLADWVERYATYLGDDAHSTEADLLVLE